MLSARHYRYIAIESLIGAVICLGLSVFFVWLMFHGQRHIEVGPLIIDSAPQTFMIALMTMLVPTLITRKRVKSGAAPAADGSVRLPRNALVRSLVIALAALVIGFTANAAGFLLLAPDGLPYPAALAAKAAYGAALGAIIASIAVTAALRDRP